MPWVWILRVLDQANWNTRLDKGELIDLGVLSLGIGYNYLARISGVGKNLLPGKFQKPGESNGSC